MLIFPRREPTLAAGSELLVGKEEEWFCPAVTTHVLVWQVLIWTHYRALFIIESEAAAEADPRRSLRPDLPGLCNRIEG